MLDTLDLSLVWRIGGEKALYGSGAIPKFYGQQVLSAVLYTEGDSISGQEWRIEERPPDS